MVVFGADAAPEEDTGPYEELLPPPPLPTPLAPAPRTALETAELVAAVVNSRTETVEEFERALDGLVRHAYADRAALVEALRPALADRYWLDPERRHLYTGDLPGLEHVAAAVLGARPGGRPGQALVSWRSDCHHSDAAAARHARVAEAARRIGTRPLPFLLATPTLSTGTLDVHVLVARLAAYARLGETPAPADFAQALLRVRRDVSALPEAAALGTPKGPGSRTGSARAAGPPPSPAAPRRPSTTGTAARPTATHWTPANGPPWRRSSRRSSGPWGGRARRGAAAGTAGTPRP